MISYRLLSVVLSDWNMLHQPVLATIQQLFRYLKKNIKKKNTLRFEILRMNIFIIETALFWSRVSTKPPSAPSESLFQMEFKQRLKIEKFSFQYGLFSLKTNLTKVNIKQIPTTARSRGDYLH